MKRSPMPDRKTPLRRTHLRAVADGERVKAKRPKSMETTGKEKWRRSYARTVAKKNGWLPPLAWDDIDRDPEPPAPDVPDVDVDEAVVHRVLAGERLPANTAERAEIVRRWLDSGRPLVSLEQLTGWNGRREKDRAMRTAS